MDLDYFICKLTLFCIFGKFIEHFIKALFSFYYIRTIKKVVSIYFDNH